RRARSASMAPKAGRTSDLPVLVSRADGVGSSEHATGGRSHRRTNLGSPRQHGPHGRRGWIHDVSSRYSEERAVVSGSLPGTISTLLSGRRLFGAGKHRDPSKRARRRLSLARDRTALAELHAHRRWTRGRVGTHPRLCALRREISPLIRYRRWSSRSTAP